MGFKVINFNFKRSKDGFSKEAVLRLENRNLGLRRVVFSFLLFSSLFFPNLSYAYTPDQLANAIYKAEGSKSHPYGILTHYKHTTPRQACLNTIAHARRDWNGKGDFLLFLQRRYAPIGAKNDPKGLNKNWLKNVKYWLVNNDR
jgi:hypothetical protein